MFLRIALATALLVLPSLPALGDRYPAGMVSGCFLHRPDTTREQHRLLVVAMLNDAVWAPVNPRLPRPNLAYWSAIYRHHFPEDQAQLDGFLSAMPTP